MNRAQLRAHRRAGHVWKTGHDGATYCSVCSVDAPARLQSDALDVAVVPESRPNANPADANDGAAHHLREIAQ